MELAPTFLEVHQFRISVLRFLRCSLLAGSAGEGEGEMNGCKSLFQLHHFVLLLTEMQRRVSIQASFQMWGAETTST